MSLEGGCWRLRTEDGRFTGYRLDTVLSRMKMIIEVFW